MSIKTFFAVIVSFIVAILVAFNIYSYNREINQRTDLALKNQMETANTVAVTVREFIFSSAKILQLSGISMVVSPELKTKDFLNDVISENPQFKSISFNDVSGKTVVETGVKIPVTQNEAKRLKKERKIFVSDLKKKNDLLYFKISAPVVVKGTYVGFVQGAISDKTIFRLVEVRIGEKGNVGVIDSSGRAVTLTFDPDVSFENRDRKFIPSIKSALKGKSAIVRRFYDPLGNTFRMGASVPIKDIGWVANVFRPVEEVSAPVRKAALRQAVFLIFASLLVILILAFFTSLIINPLESLSRTTTAIYKGDYSKRIKPRFFIVELRQLAKSFNKMLVNIVGRLQKEKYVSETLQTGLLPMKKIAIEGYNIGTYYASATEEALVGGDFYDVISLSEHTKGFVVGDVRGKGVEAALTTSITKFILRDIAATNPSPSAVLSELNGFLFRQFALEEFVSLFYIILNLKTGVAVYSNAGHPQPFVYDFNTKKIRQLKIFGSVLGVFEKGDFHSGELKLEKGQQIFLYTDGVIETMNEDRELFGEERLRELLISYPAGAQEKVEQVYEAILDFSKGRLTDDTAMLVIEKL